jgi:hypothetical protein
MSDCLASFSKGEPFMTHMVIDTTLSARLNQVSQPVTLCDPAGRVLGRFFPSDDMSEWEAIGPQISDAELDRRMKSKEKRFTTTEVIAHLESL